MTDFDPACSTPDEFRRYADVCERRGRPQLAHLWRWMAFELDNLAPELAEIEAEMDADRTGRDARGRIVDGDVLGFRVSWLWGVATGVLTCAIFEIWARVLL